MVGLKKEETMNNSLEEEIEEIVDKQLQELGFIDLCTRIAQKVVEKVQKIDEEHSIIKTELNDIEQKLTQIFSDKKPPEIKTGERKKDVIVIEEEDEKPLVERLHEITTSCDFSSPEKAAPTIKKDSNGRLVTLGAQNETNISTTAVSMTPVSTAVASKQSIDRQTIGSKRNANGSIVNRENNNGSSLSSRRVISTSSETTKGSPASSKPLEIQTQSVKNSHQNEQTIPVTSTPSSKVTQARTKITPKNIINSPLLFESTTATSKPEIVISNEKKSNMSSESSGNSTMRSKSRPSAQTIPSSNVVISGNRKVSTESAQVVPSPSSSVVSEQSDKSGTKETSSLMDKDVSNKGEIIDEKYVFKEGDHIVGKPEKGDIWYPAKISKIIVNKYGQHKFHMKFDSGHKLSGTLPANHIAPLSHPQASQLHIGSRVAACRPRDTVDVRVKKKYASLSSISSAKGDILYGGVIVERACEETKHRFLVFFDDGFAQYMTEKKIHHVIHAAKDVWEDVSIHCREFIKEYLEEYPDRPMLKLKAGLSVQTEWNGKWLQARVIAVDGSLVKMLFDIDKRTEWIYRGSTRLEPLYSELERRDLEALKSKGKKSNKKKKAATPAVKKVEPYVEDAITKPCFGISRFSTTDPQGIQQIKEWGPVVETKTGTYVVSLDHCGMGHILCYSKLIHGIGSTSTTRWKKAEATGVEDSASVQGSDAELEEEPDVVGESPVKIAFDFDKKHRTSIGSKKRKADDNLSGHSSDTSDRGSTRSRNSESKDTSNAGNKTATTPSTLVLELSPSPKPFQTSVASQLQRHSSQSSIDSVATESLVGRGNSKQRRFERALNASLRNSNNNQTSPQSNRQGLPLRDVAILRRKSTSSLSTEEIRSPRQVLITNTPAGAPKKIVISPMKVAFGQFSPFANITEVKDTPPIQGQPTTPRRNSSQEKLKESPKRQRMILPYPPSPHLQYWGSPQGMAQVAVPQMALHRIPVSQMVIPQSPLPSMPIPQQPHSLPRPCFPRSIPQQRSPQQRSPQQPLPQQRSPQQPLSQQRSPQQLLPQQSLTGIRITNNTNHMMALINLTQSFPKFRGPHQCTPACIPDIRIPLVEKRKHNPMSIPLLLGWTRETAKRRPGYHRDIYYRSPCSRRLRNLAEVTRCLLQTKATNVTIDQFSFDSSVSCRDQLPVFKTPRLKIDDLSFGKEPNPILCVNEKNDEYPPRVEYISERMIGEGIRIQTDPGFLACCSCDDNCQDKTKCACSRHTINSSDAIDGKIDETCGYQYRRLKECVTTGIYECNKNCSCKSNCYNRVVQNGIGIRLQVFMTDHKGWGLRCLDDVPRGTFICTYTGQILNEEMADKEGTDFGDEYLAELDHIEIVEQAKEGYESDVPELGEENKPTRNLSDESFNKEDSESEESEYEYSESSDSSDNTSGKHAADKNIFKKLLAEVQQEKKSSESTDKTKSNRPQGVIDLTLDSDPEDRDKDSKLGNTIQIESSEVSKSLAESASESASKLKEEVDEKKPNSFESMIHRLKMGDEQNEVTANKLKVEKSQEDSLDDIKITNTKSEQRTKKEQNNSKSPLFYIEDDSCEDLTDSKNIKVKNERLIGTKEDIKSEVKSQSTVDQSAKAKLSEEVRKAVQALGPKIRKAVAKKSTKSILFQRLVDQKTDNDLEINDSQSIKQPVNRSLESVASSDLNQSLNSGKTFTSPRSSTGGHFSRKAALARMQITPPGAPQGTSETVEPEKKSIRQLFGEDQCYVIDAKSYGNVGRYLNHSCVPNLFVQNVFVDTHDLRFPLVAFFAQQNIPALTELTWDYSYDVGSVPGKVLQCYCGASECRGRLL